MGKSLDYSEVAKSIQNEISHKLQVILADLLSCYFEYDKVDFWNSKYEEPAFLYEVREEIVNDIGTLPQIVIENFPFEPNRKDFLEKYILYKKQLLDMDHTLKQYISELGYIRNRAENCLHQQMAKEFSSDKIVFNAGNLLNDCIKFIDEEKNELIRNIKISKMMSCLPVKMVRARYFEYIRRSIDMFQNEAMDDRASYVEGLKIQFSGYLGDYEKKYFDDIASVISEISEIQFEDLNTEDLRVFLFDIVDIIEEANDVSEKLSMIFSGVNSLIFIYTFVVDMDQLLDEDFAFKDAYYCIKETIENKRSDTDDFFENIIQIIQQRSFLLEEKIAASEDKNEKYMAVLKEGDVPFEIAELIQINYSISLYFNENIGKSISVVNLQRLTDEEVEYFIDFVAIGINSLEPKKARFLKQHFIGQMVTPFDLEEFKGYLLDNIESIADPIALETVSIAIYSLFNIDEDGLYENFENEEDDDDDGCTCEHHHH